MLVRKSNWPEALAAYVESRRYMPFQWGVNDCCMFAAGAVEAMTGVNPAADLAGTYASRRGARRVLARVGDGSLRDSVALVLGGNITPLCAKRGDIVVVAVGDTADMCLAVNLGEVWAAPGNRNLVFGPVQQATLAWSV